MDEIILFYFNYIFYLEIVCCFYREKYYIYYNILLCNKKINIEKKNDNEFDNYKIIFGNMDFKDIYYMSSLED